MFKHQNKAQPTTNKKKWTCCFFKQNKTEKKRWESKHERGRIVREPESAWSWERERGRVRLREGGRRPAGGGNVIGADRGRDRGEGCVNVGAYSSFSVLDFAYLCFQQPNLPSSDVFLSDLLLFLLLWLWGVIVWMLDDDFGPGLGNVMDRRWIVIARFWRMDWLL